MKQERTDEMDCLDFLYSTQTLDEKKEHFLDQELDLISRCYSEIIIRRFLSIALILYITYGMVYGLNTLPAFYILGVTSLLPYILSCLVTTKKNDVIRSFPQMKKKYKVIPERYQTDRYALSFVFFLLFLWQIVQNRTHYIYLILNVYPILLLTICILCRLFFSKIFQKRIKSRLENGFI